jgi:hypothetical protein
MLSAISHREVIVDNHCIYNAKVLVNKPRER